MTLMNSSDLERPDIEPEPPAPAGGSRAVTTGIGIVALAATLALYVGAAKLGLAPFALLGVMALAVPVLAVGATVVARNRHRLIGTYSLALLSAPISYYLAFFLVPLVILAVYSFSTQSGFAQITFGFSWHNYRDALDSVYLKALLESFKYAVGGTIATVAVGFPFAYWLTRYAPPNRRQLFVALALVPFWTSFLIRVYAMVVLLSENFALANWLRDIGLVHGDMGLLNHPGGVFIGLAYGYLPLCILPLYATLDRMDWTLVQASNDLGASKLRTFRQITLPIVMPGVLTAALLVFIPMMGEYIIPGILGGGQVHVIGNVVQSAFIEQQNYPFGAAVGMVVMMCLSLVMALYVYMSVRAERRIDV